ncbi:MAG: DUF3052 domain-containing protein [Pseudomonadota bacterium]
MKPAGYSGKPLSQKLGFKPGWRVGLVRAPDHYADLVADADGVSFGPLRVGADAAHVFFHGGEDLAAEAQAAIDHLRDGGMLWVSWAKKSSKLHAGVTEDMFRDTILPLGWVDTKVCAVDVDWSGLKFLKRKG